MGVIWTECSLDGQPVAAAAEPSSGPVCILGTETTGTSAAVRCCRVTAKRHDEVIAVLGMRPMSGREVARALGISPMTAIADGWVRWRLGSVHRCCPVAVQWCVSLVRHGEQRA